MTTSAAPEPVRDAPPRFVLVTGAGRSGTSTAAGALNMLGLHVPPPFLGANDSNPRGFFESEWPVTFHNRLMREVHVATVDSRPDSLRIVTDSITDEHRAEVLQWLREVTSAAPQTAVKDPRTAWTIGLWSDAVNRLGLRPSYLVMLRHPAEVVWSRATYYASNYAGLDERGFATRNLAGWINSILITERQTRGQWRTFVRYDGLLSDWRSTMSAVRDDLGLRFNTDLARGEPHAVDEFIDPALQRHATTWAGVDVPDALRDLAEEIWSDCLRLHDARCGADDEALDRLDEMSERYARLYDDARALTYDDSVARAKDAAEDAARGARRSMRKKVAEARAEGAAAVRNESNTWSRVLAGFRRRAGLR